MPCPAPLCARSVALLGGGGSENQHLLAHSMGKGKTLLMGGPPEGGRVDTGLRPAHGGRPGKNRRDLWVEKWSRATCLQGLPASGRESEETKAEIIQEAGAVSLQEVGDITVSRWECMAPAWYLGICP